DDLVREQGHSVRYEREVGDRDLVRVDGDDGMAADGRPVALEREPAEGGAVACDGDVLPRNAGHAVKVERCVVGHDVYGLIDLQRLPVVARSHVYGPAVLGAVDASLDALRRGHEDRLVTELQEACRAVGAVEEHVFGVEQVLDGRAGRVHTAEGVVADVYRFVAAVPGDGARAAELVTADLWVYAV